MKLNSSLKILALATAMSLSGLTGSIAQDNRSSQDMIRALKPKKSKTRSRSFSNSRSFGAKRSLRKRKFIQGLTGQKTRQITVEERKELTTIIREEKLPTIDLTILFKYDSTQVTIESERTLIRLGQALSHRDLKGATVLIAGHTDASGSDYYNLDLSKRRAEAIKAFLYRNFGLDATKIITVGYGEEQLRVGLDPYSAAHRRVQVTNLNQ